MGLATSSDKGWSQAKPQGLGCESMFDATRFRSLMADRDMSQSELARRVGVAQTTIAKLASGRGYGSKHLHRIARELGTTPAYLTGEIDDPEAGAPPPALEPQFVHVMLPVALPARPALTRMFLGHLRSLGDWSEMPEDELAHELATLLPTGLGVLKGPLRFEQSDVGDEADEPAEEEPNAGSVPRRARRT